MSKSKLIDKIGQFTTIPNSVIAMWPTIGVDAMALFLYLRYRTNSQSGDAFPSFDTIKKDTGLTRNRIAKSARVLESAGLVERKRRFSASTIYTLKMPDVIETEVISKDVGLMESPISKDVGLPLVKGVDTNQIDSIKTESNTPKSKTRDIQAAYIACVNYPVDWKKNEGHAAKWLADNGYTADDVTACYKFIASDPWWSDKQITLSAVKNKIGAWKSTQKKRTIKLQGVVNA